MIRLTNVVGRKITAIAKLDPNAALVLIDVQKGVAGLPTAHPTSKSIARAWQLARAFRERQIPVVLVNATAGP